MSKRTTFTVDPDVAAIIEANRGRESEGKTINRLIRRAGCIEDNQALLMRIKELVERNLAAFAAVHEEELVGPAAERKEEYLQAIRNEK